MQKDVIFQGLIGAVVSLLFVGVSQIEIPFYPVEQQVQLVAVVCFAISLLVMTAGYFYRPRTT